MRWPLLLCSLVLVGCGASQRQPAVDLGPAAVGNANTALHVSDAKVRGQKIVREGVKPNDPTAIKLVLDLNAALDSIKQVNSDLVVAQGQIQDLTDKNAKLEAQHTSDMAAVNRRNWLFVVALFLGALVFYAGEWAKLASPYTLLLPNVVAGMLLVMVFSVLCAVVISFWSTFGWLIHLL